MVITNETPEKKLMYAIIESAMNDLARFPKTNAYYQNAYTWLRDTTPSDYLCSFENICLVLDLNADYMRKGILKWAEEKRKERNKRKISGMLEDIIRAK